MQLAKALIGMALALWPASDIGAQTSDLDQIKDASDRYNQCVYFAAIGRISASDQDISRAAESAFLSCTTEQDYIVVVMTNVGMSKQQIERALLDKKTGIKQELRKMLLESKGLK